ncbi:VOC family protein [Geodermatophilus ruber]|uniref:3,4-dihydroxy-9,10-secoandrosta-1,3,5(10)-triene-9,17-dione 4,5-dioxygenase n=1 Tax=Geodermatophilus ruber TaxID=504800 RepID=A0A1I4GI94_9ACTN|nr:VOC family protein [Geodermatophilus ruber]SFL29758.1 3,4-dihydroxy-9,10-secoandrosta-1,3,5(10)-triene-9,17-dione 4,5-dioxygenase [Geodermatophilus ruber]
MTSNVTALGYLVVRGPVEEWRRFGAEVLGIQEVASDHPGEAHFRTDERAYRIVVEDGPPSGPMSLQALGFETATEPQLRKLVDSLTAQGVEVTEDTELARRRKVRSLYVFRDFDGNRLEAYYGQAADHSAFVSPRGVRFVTGDLGVGHAFLFSADAEKAAAFYTDVLGFRLSDTIDLGIAEGIFLHCNPRHHSIAVASIPGPPPGLGHLMLEVESLEAVGRAFDTVKARGDAITMTLGEHTNDLMTSFYVNTPSGFQVEYGCNGRLIDDEKWTVSHYDAASIWGHQFQDIGAPPAPAEAAHV